MREYSGHIGPSVKVADRELPEDVAQAMRRTFNYVDRVRSNSPFDNVSQSDRG